MAETHDRPVGALRGYDDMERRERRKMCRALIRKAKKITPEEEREMTVLLLMALGMSEAEARADVRLRDKQKRDADKPLPW